MVHLNGGNSLCCVIFAAIVLSFFLFKFDSSTSLEKMNTLQSKANEHRSDPCSGKYIYAYDLPRKFNSDVIKECDKLDNQGGGRGMDMCYYLTNGGLGPKLENGEGVLPAEGWFATDQFALDMIFHEKMKYYKCLTKSSSLASAVYVPFYAGIEVARYLWLFNTTMRDSTSHSLFQWLRGRPEWQVMGGRDHFMVAGRIASDFRRRTNIGWSWGSDLLWTPEAKNMTVLVIESNPDPSYTNDFAIPYPTYFHPSTDKEVFEWQNVLRKQEKKKHLFCFVGAPRPGQKYSIRNQIIDQCRSTNGTCKLLECAKCQSPVGVMKLFKDSVFCLQPPGDSPTRKSTFDSILAGCIPVFFHPGSAYNQYIWYLPQNNTSYSVFIPEGGVREGKTNIESILSKISDEDVKAMREEVIRLIPKLIYTHPRAKTEEIEDAFDIAVKNVIEKVNEVKLEMKVSPQGNN